MKPLCIDLFCGLGGWAEGFLSEGYDVIGYDIERHEYGDQKYPAELRIKDVLDITAAEIRALNPRMIVASPPCQEPSYRAMPWSKAKALNGKPPSNFLCLFYACFKIAQDADVPVIVENVKGAQPWVGPARWHFGAYYLWGDIPALMPIGSPAKVSGQNWRESHKRGEVFPCWTAQVAQPKGTGATSWFFGNRKHELRATSSGSVARKQASAMIAKIPFPLASHIARCFK